MARKSKAKFELKGHTLPGINKKSETVNKADGRSPSSVFQMKSPTKQAGDSPNKFVGLAAGALLGQTKFGKNLMSKGKNLLGNIGNKLGVGGGGSENEDADAGKKLLKEEAKAEMEEGV